MDRIMVMTEVNGRLHACGFPLLGEVDRASIKAHTEGRHLPKALMRIHRDEGARRFVRRLLVDTSVRPSSKHVLAPAGGAQVPLDLTPSDTSGSLPRDVGTLTEQQVRSHDGRRGLRVIRLEDGLHCIEVTPAMHPAHGLSVRFTGGRLGASKATGVAVTLDQTSLLAVTAVLIGDRNSYDGGRDVDGADNALSVMRHADGRVITRLVPRGGHVVSLALPGPDVAALSERLISRVRRRYPRAHAESIRSLLARVLPAHLPGDDRAV